MKKKTKSLKEKRWNEIHEITSSTFWRSGLIYKIYEWKPPKGYNLTKNRINFLENSSTDDL